MSENIHIKGEFPFEAKSKKGSRNLTRTLNNITKRLANLKKKLAVKTKRREFYFVLLINVLNALLEVFRSYTKENWKTNY